ncbi:MAG TPA: HEPN domain-containing protein [Thermoanaerobaculia bacterium]
MKAAFARARQKLEVARHVLAGGYAADAVSPAYYAAFHAAEAALLVEGDEPRSQRRS